jgi:hypothetical protein
MAEVLEREVLNQLEDALRRLRDSKPEERSEKARRVAVTITEMEKVIAYYKTFVYDATKE